MKKLLSLFLTIALLISIAPISLFCITASAAESGYYTYTVSNGEATITDVNTAISGAVTIPSTLGGYPVTSIGGFAFSRCTGLTSITISDGVTSIGTCAFEECTSLTSINIPDSVASLGFHAFESCSGLTDISVDVENNYFCSVGGVLFNKDKTELILHPAGKTDKTYTVPGSVTSIGDHAFESCSGLADISVDVENNYFCSVGGVLFNKDKTELILHPAGKTDKTYTVPESVTSIGRFAFEECTGLTSITISDGVTSIGDFAFSYCTGLTSINIPGSVTSIGGFAFRYCSGLTSINISDGETSIGAGAFSYCTGLTSINIPNGVTYIGENAFYYCTGLTSINIPDSVTSIGAGAFPYCTGLTSINIPDSVTSIGRFAFSSCTGLTAINIPGGVTSIGNYAFYSCDSLKTVFFKGTREQKETMPIGTNNNALDCAQWHYEVENTVFANQECYYCKECNDYYLYDGSHATATVIFKNWDGTELSKQTYRYNDEITVPPTPQKQSDSTFEYTFAGWDKEVVNCAGDAVYTAIYTPQYIDYTVSFKDWDGAIISSQTYHYGDKVTVPADPTKAADNTYTYVFAGWDKEVGACNGNVTYTATYASAYIDYTVVFKDWNGTIVSSQTYHYGDKVTVPADPARKNDNTYTYTFRGWDKEIVDCVGDATYTATYTSTYIDYTVVFKDWNGTVLSTKTYHYGDKVTAPANPTKAADNTYTYTFNGWDKTVVDCVGDVIYTATYTQAYIDYTIVFKDWNGTVLSAKTYHYGDKVTAPANPAKAADNTYSYAFAGWDKTVVDCVGDATYTATYASAYIDYTVVFKDWNGTVLSTKTYHYGDKVTAPANPIKAADNTYTYNFNGWDKTVTDCVGDATYIATYTSNYIDYTVTFRYEDGTVIKQYTLHYGDSVAAPAVPAVPDTLGDDYKFSGWDKEVTNCQGNAVYTAEFVRKYMFGDLNRDGVIQPWECLKARRAFFGLVATTDEILCAMDSNGNGRVDANECMKQRRIFFGLI